LEKGKGREKQSSGLILFVYLHPIATKRKRRRKRKKVLVSPFAPEGGRERTENSMGKGTGRLHMLFSNLLGAG